MRPRARALLAGAALAGMLAGSSAKAQTTVIDPLNIAATLKTYYQQVQSYLTQVQQLAQQIQTAANTLNILNSFVQNPNLGTAMGVLNVTGVGNPLPVNPYALQGLLSGQGGFTGALGNLSALTSGMASTNQFAPPNTATYAGQSMATNAGSIAGAQATAMTVYQQMAQHFAVLTALRQQAAQATTPAGREAVMEQLQTEAAWAILAGGQLQSAYILITAQQAVNVERDNEKLTNDLCVTINACPTCGFALNCSGSAVSPSGISASSLTTSITTDPGSTAQSSQSAAITTDAGTTSDTGAASASSAGSSTPVTSGSGSTALDTMLAQPWGQAAVNNAQALGVNPSALAATCVVESGCQAIGGSGNAQGAFQMMPVTYTSSLNTALANNPQLASNIISGTAGMTDPATESIASSQYLLQGAQSLQANGVANPTVLDVRGYYNFGPAGGANIATASASETMASALPMYSAAQLAQNGITPGETVGQWRATVAGKIGNAAGQPVLLSSSQQGVQ